MARLPAALLLALATLAASHADAAPRERLTIGISQFPSNLHPNIDSMAAKSYVLGLSQRPLTTYDAMWELVCMLCTGLPTLENGRAACPGATGAGRYSTRGPAARQAGVPATPSTARTAARRRRMLTL